MTTGNMSRVREINQVLRDRVAELETRLRQVADYVHPAVADAANARADAAERNYQYMVERAADQKLDGYRELAQKLNCAETEAAALRAQLSGKGVCDGRCRQADGLRVQLAKARGLLARVGADHMRLGDDWLPDVLAKVKP